MPIMTEDDVLRLEPGMDVAPIEGAFADENKEVEIVATADVTTPGGIVNWSKIKILDDAFGADGWVRTAHIDPKGVPPGGPVEKLTFARQCWVEALFSDANPHYVAAVAEQRSSTVNDRTGVAPDQMIGPFRLTQAEWDAARAVAEFGVDSFSVRDIADWRMQVVVFTLMTHRTEQALAAALNTVTAGRRPSAAELYLAQLIGVKAAVAALTTIPSPTIKAVFDGVAAADQPVDRPLGAPSFDKIVPRYAELFDAGQVTGEQAIDRIVARLDPVLVTTMGNIVSAGEALLGAPVDDVVVGDGSSSAGGPSELGTMGKTFTERAPVIMRRLMMELPQLQDFHAAGVLGNIGRETGGFRLMQEVRPRKGRGGLGWLQWTGSRRLTFEQFCQPPRPGTLTSEGNFAFMIHEMKTIETRAFRLFAQTTTLESATKVFMDEYERPGVRKLDERIDWARKAMAAFRNPAMPGVNRTVASGPVVASLRSLIATGRIIFDKPALKDELLGLNTGTQVAPKLQTLVLRLCELTEVIRISSLVRASHGSFHAAGRAVDIGNQEIAGALLPLIATAAKVRELEIDELIFDARVIDPANDRNKFNFDRGVKHNFDLRTTDGHRDHIHFAVTG